MARLKHLIEMARRLLDHTRAEKKTLRKLIQRMQKSSRSIPITLGEIESMRRSWRAQRLIGEIEDQLKNSMDPKKRAELIACSAFVEFLLEAGHEIPNNHDGLLKIHDELSSKARIECFNYVSCVSRTESMLKHAARHENPSQKN